MASSSLHSPTTNTVGDFHLPARFFPHSRRGTTAALFQLRRASVPLRSRSNPLRKTPPFRRSFVVFQKVDADRNGGGGGGGGDFITRVLKENPSQVEPKFLVGDRFLTLREKQRSGEAPEFRVFQLLKRLLGESGVKKEGDEGGGGRGGEASSPVYLKDILREFRGKLYVPEEVFKGNLSEEEEFERNLKELPAMTFEDFQKHLMAGKIKLLTSRSDVGSPPDIGYRDFVVDLKEMPGDKSIQKTKWAIRLSASQARAVMEEYTGPQYEIEKHTMSYVGKLPEYPHPVASSISSRVMVELGMITALIAAAGAVITGFVAAAVFVVTSFLYAATFYVVWPLARPFLKLALGIVSNIAEGIWEYIIDMFSEGGIFSKIYEFYTFGGISASIEMLKPIMFVLVTMVLLVRFTLSRRPKNFRKWDIWQGIEFGQSKPQARVDGSTGVKFSDVAGIDEAVEELQEVNKPSVVFVDEIDALATRRQGIFSESTDYLYNAATQERETTLNQLLIELDGFDTGKGVIFLGATNRMDLLDPALLRPGRFDRKIRIRPPGTKGRLDILKVHARKVKMSPTVDLSTYAQNLPGWTGAQLAQLVQESALVAVRNRHDSILQSDMDDAVDRLTIGPKRLGIDLGHQGQCRRAVTEVGVAITSHLLRRYENAKVEFCERISIIPRGQTLSQIVFRHLDEESYMFERRPQLLHRLQVLLGGRAAEEVVYGQDTSKASLKYLEDATCLARKILCIWNLENPMTIHGEPFPWIKKPSFVGPRLDFEGSLYDDYNLIEPPINFDLDDRVAQRTEELMRDMYRKTISMLRRHAAALLKTTKVLLDNKEINGDQIEFILNSYAAETPVKLVLEEKNPGSLPFFEVDGDRDMVLSPLLPMREAAQ
ncbi:probable inactive ATP-dependent zinc metalloprotease FTSHI 1, chloroplastic isoform X2 [Elaeis guineensis]|uniref:Probable inactive ATP-dependent zinc metalloprotease FTSHI 1, chloroplastic isoform X2 n=1 Tax=Elaeis guineensis var. tenera TaxID=51953 RepID=A0A8N4IG02_ELAGV|nr:probable inactive ATP-dependent zinc metalloprotease FTSHI 1, chloroplastic isoform X2 [Elaeis guineensis]